MTGRLVRRSYRGGRVAAAAVVVLTAMASVTVTVVTAAPAGADSSTFTIANNQDLPIAPGGSALSHVSCASSTLCVATGGDTQSWDGTAWTVDSTPVPAGPVSCAPGTSFCMAGGSGGFESFDGTTWTAVASSVPTPFDISCPTATYCMAVGANDSAETWDGTSWTPTASDGSSGDTVVSCPTTSFCEVGAYGSTINQNGPPVELTFPVLESYDGSTWTSYGPFAGGAVPGGGGVFSALSCATPSYCMGFSSAGIDINGNNFVEPPSGPKLDSVTCTDVSACTAVGGGAVETWNGSTWTSSTVEQQPLTNNSFNDVSCAGAAFCVAVGLIGWPSKASTLIESNVAMPQPDFSAAASVSPVADPGVTGPNEVSVTMSGDSGTPTGSVTILHNGSSCSGELVAGAMSCSLVEDAPSSQVQAVYSGDGVYAPTVSTGSQTLSRGSVTMTVTPAMNPAPNGQVAYIVGFVYPGSLFPTGGATLVDNVGGTCTIQTSNSCSINEAASATPYTVTATYPGNGDYLPATASTTETVTQSPSFTSPTTATATAGMTFSFPVTTYSPGFAPVIKAIAMPSGLRLYDHHDGTATISGTPGLAISGNYDVTLTAAVPGRPTGMQVLVISVDNTPKFLGIHKATTAVGDTLDFPLTTVRGFPAPAFTVSSGELPEGITLSDNGNGTAALVGTVGPGTGGVYAFTITATNGVGVPVQRDYLLTVNQPPAFTSAPGDTITSGQLMTNFTVQTTGFPVPIMRAMGLPLGLHLINNHNQTATLTGLTHVAPGTYNVTITALSRAGIVSQAFSLVVT